MCEDMRISGVFLMGMSEANLEEHTKLVIKELHTLQVAQSASGSRFK